MNPKKTAIKPSSLGAGNSKQLKVRRGQVLLIRGMTVIARDNLEVDVVCECLKKTRTGKGYCAPDVSTEPSFIRITGCTSKEGCRRCRMSFRLKHPDGVTVWTDL